MAFLGRLNRAMASPEYQRVLLHDAEHADFWDQIAAESIEMDRREDTRWASVMLASCLAATGDELRLVAAFERVPFPFWDTESLSGILSAMYRAGVAVATIREAFAAAVRCKLVAGHWGQDLRATMLAAEVREDPRTPEARRLVSTLSRRLYRRVFFSAELLDACRILVSSETECERTLNLLAAMWCSEAGNRYLDGVTDWVDRVEEIERLYATAMRIALAAYGESLPGSVPA